jgi:hypothetical protein
MMTRWYKSQRRLVAQRLFLSLVVSPGVYEGPDEREGSYTLRIEKDNYQTIITGQINPLTDECGLITEVLSYELEEL